MPLNLNELLQSLKKSRCCPPPPAPTGLGATYGGGSGEVMVTWDPLPASAKVAFYRVYMAKGPGRWWNLAVVAPSTLGDLMPGKIGIVDAPDYWPWPTIGSAARCYRISAVSTDGLEGPMSAEVCQA